ncbi:hypothetical protein [Roseisolibacter sp. H3M3-2]|uniref:hypothetical protein n=1 Tax=Roseisolibacter sp. H3M3-2 TaxID=3031323 RepID=UPI0023DC7F1B|nr:hypothetical protein [Roseisolibacter sp. H3M3-2]
MSCIVVVVRVRIIVDESRIVVESRMVVSRDVVGVCVGAGVVGAGVVGVCAAATPALTVRAMAAPIAREVMNRIVITSILQIAAEAAGFPYGRVVAGCCR